MDKALVVVFAITGGFVWLLGAFAFLLFLFLGVIPEIWRQGCYVGYAMFASKARKQAVRERARSLAEDSANPAPRSEADGS